MDHQLSGRNMRIEAAKWIKHDEGLSLKPYLCTSGFHTIGYGHNLDYHPIGIPLELLQKYGISEEGAIVLLNEDMECCISKLDNIRVFNTLSLPRKVVLINMCYNLGFPRLTMFKKMFQALNSGSYVMASYEMLDSKWADQVPKRAKRLADTMLTNVLPDLR